MYMVIPMNLYNHIGLPFGVLSELKENENGQIKNRFRNTRTYKRNRK